MRVSLLLLVLLPLAACAHRNASGSASRVCKPVADEPRFAAYGHVYAACEVDQLARPQRSTMETATRVEAVGSAGVSRASMPTQRCSTAEVEFVIDPTGTVIPGSVRLVRTTDTEYGETVVRMASRIHYTPAQRKGEPVAQLGQMKMQRGAVVVVRSGSMPPTSRPPAC